MYTQTINGIYILKFDVLRDKSKISCAVSTRKHPDGGELDLGMTSCGSVEEHKKNVSLFASTLNIKDVAFMRQKHTANVARVIKDHTMFENTDCMITNVPDIGLLALSADCGLTCLYDEKNNAVAVMHSGWRGAFLNIYSAALNAMRMNFGTKAEDIIACAAPMISAKYYEVKEDFIEKIKLFYPFDYEKFITVSDKRYFFDLRALLKFQLFALKINKTEFSSLCTYEEKTLFPSWRRDGVKAKHFGMLATLKK